MRASLEINLIIGLIFNSFTQEENNLHDYAEGSGLHPGLPDISSMNASQLLKLIAAARQRLSSLGLHDASDEENSEPQLLQQTRSASYAAKRRIRITQDYRILLPDMQNTEIKLKPLCKVLFILYLRHPEGISFKDLCLHEEEMLQIYGKINRRGDSLSMRRTIRHLTDSTGTAASVSRSQLSRTLSDYLDNGVLQDYVISCGNGSPRSINVNRNLVEWE